jgi:hypothetical protein
MSRFFTIVALILCATGTLTHASLAAEKPKPPITGHYLFAWTGDAAQKGNDFLAVIDADPTSPNYGHLVTTLVTDQQTMRVHHTEYTMPASGMLFANDHNAGRTFIFDVRDPLHPSIVTSFTDMAGYMHPHSYLRLPNGHVLATFQHSTHEDMSDAPGKTGGLVEIDDSGKVIRSASNADPAFPDAFLTPYSLVVLPKIDRVVSTNSSMQEEGIFRGVTYQIWRLSDLKLLKTEYFDVGENRFAQISPEEPRLGPDGAVYVQTLGCGIERITGVDSDRPRSQLVYSFPSDWCGVPTIVGHYLLQSVPYMHSIVALDIANGTKPVEVSRMELGDHYFPHWTGWDEKTNRVVVTGGGNSDPRLYLLKFDPATGALAMDDAFHDSDGKPGFNFADREWPHGWKGTGKPHGAVFSR